jgi:DNA-binding SARP family transcriptional activator
VDPDVRFGVLGPLVVAGGTGVRGGRQRVLLAALLLSANMPVSCDALAEVVWDGSPPAGAAVTLRSHVRRLRRALGPQDGTRIAARAPGYLICLQEPELDVLRFEALCAAAAAARQAGRWAEVPAAAAQAAGLWRGDPLLDVPSQLLHDEFVPRLEQLRLQVAEDQIEAALRLGQHDRLVPQLRDLTARQPLRERFHGQLMQALAGAGRQAEALEAYRQARQVLAGELGVEPGPELQLLHRKILAGDPGLSESSATQGGMPPADGAILDPAAVPGRLPVVVPRQLPAPVRHFAGRRAELSRLTGLIGEAAAPLGPVLITTIGGMAGVGKTALAVHWAHQVASRFPAGQLYVNLRGFDPSGQPVAAAEAVRAMLEALGVPAGQAPAGPDAQAGLYRSLLAGKRMLVLLDNARDAEQIRPLLPGGPGCLVVVTSRSELAELAALDGAIAVTVDLLTASEARELLARRLGPARLTGEQAAVGDLIDLCARLPLALNIAASRAAASPGVPLSSLTAELRDSRRRLDLLSAGTGAADLRAVFSWSCQTLNSPAARMFCLLGVHPGPDISLAAAASLAATDRGQTRQVLDELTAAHLLTEHYPGRYSLHDLLRVYAREQAQAARDQVDCRAAACRVLDHYLHTVRAASFQLYPARDLGAVPAPRPGAVPESFTSGQDALAWLGTERPVLVAATTKAAGMQFGSHAWQLASALAVYLERAGHWHDYAATQTVALAAAENAGDLAGQADAHRLLGRACSRTGAHPEAQAHLRRALKMYDALGDRAGQAHAHHNLGWILGQQRRYRQALQHARQALALYQGAGHRTGQARTLNTVGWYGSLLGDHQQALAYCQQALDLHHELGNNDGEADAWDSLGHAHHHLGHPAEAITCYTHALNLFRELGDRHAQACTLGRLGDAHHAADHLQQARSAWQQALDILTDLHHADAHDMRSRLSAPLR